VEGSLSAYADKDPSTGWYGYDYLVNGQITDGQNTMLQKYDPEEGEWLDQNSIEFAYSNNQLELILPRNQIGLEGEKLTFDFKWSDNPNGLEDPISMCTGGDTAPNRRFNYRYIWKK
jgi:hypothetical protein